MPDLPQIPDVMWFIPLVGLGGADDLVTPFHPVGIPTGAGGASIHADWWVNSFHDLLNPYAALIQKARSKNVTFYQPVSGVPVQRDSFTHWEWETVFCNAAPLLGSSLTLSAAFSRFFDYYGPNVEDDQTHLHVTRAYKTVYAWAKFRVGYADDPSNPGGSVFKGKNVSGIYLELCDHTGKSFSYYDYSGGEGMVLGSSPGWQVASLRLEFNTSPEQFAPAYPPENDADWVNRNLRFNVVFLGPSAPDPSAADNLTRIDVEWLAIAMVGEYDVTGL